MGFFSLVAGRELKDMGVSKNRGIPKWMVYNGFFFLMDDLGVPLFLETPISLFLFSQTLRGKVQPTHSVEKNFNTSKTWVPFTLPTRKSPEKRTAGTQRKQWRRGR